MPLPIALDPGSFLHHVNPIHGIGINASCVRDNRAYSYVPSRNGETISDKVALHVPKWTDQNCLSDTHSSTGKLMKSITVPLK